ncbi:hypothetical protein AMELA_G00064200 [Ameiurus melas]|uniref:Uncharacterized protein n=1 Tax=Ameiurus melas TaxID=219545 RepID=A0A7J6B681_AMEME|nr:hypothetical protein AMELA_G00064200 [Ameiurus melas]
MFAANVDWVTGKPGDYLREHQAQGARYTLDRVPIHHRAHNHIHTPIHTLRTLWTCQSAHHACFFGLEEETGHDFLFRQTVVCLLCFTNQSSSKQSRRRTFLRIVAFL